MWPLNPVTRLSFTLLVLFPCSSPNHLGVTSHHLLWTPGPPPPPPSGQVRAAACNSTQMKRIQKLLNFATRVLSGRRKFDHISDVLHQLDWLTAERMYLYYGLNLLKRMLCTSEPESIAGDLVTRGDVHHRATRNADHLVTPAIRSESGRRRFRYSMVAEYNALPSDIRCLTRPNFKRKLRQHMLIKQRGGVG